MVLRESLFLSSILLNSEAWVNYKEQDIRILEQCDKVLLSNILECDRKSSNNLNKKPAIEKQKRLRNSTFTCSDCGSFVRAA